MIRAMDATHIYDLLTKGGPLVWPIIGCSILGLAIFFERFYFISRLRRMDRYVLKILEGGKLPTPDAMVRQGSPQRNGPFANMFLDALKMDPRDRKGLETIFDYHIDATISMASRGLDMLATLAAISPLLGLLGTVTGLIKAFMVIEKAGGQVNAHSLAGGIWEAMLTTAVGLSVAIPLMVCHKILTARISGLEDDLQHTAFTYMMALGHNQTEEATP